MDGKVIVNNEMVMVRSIMHLWVSTRKVRGEIFMASEDWVGDMRLSVMGGAMMCQLYMRLRMMHLVMLLMMGLWMKLWGGNVRCRDLVKWFMM